MKIEIDQSGKIEATNRHSVLASSVGTRKSVIISARDKKSIQAIFRKIGQPRLFVYKLFAVMVFILIEQDIKGIDQIVIDKEYAGYENFIKDLICETGKRKHQIIDRKIIHFRSIGKKSMAHRNALSAFQNKKADIKISAKDFFKLGV